MRNSRAAFLFAHFSKKEEGFDMLVPNVDIDYCGIVQLLRHLVVNGICTRQEAKKIAARIAVQTGASIFLPLFETEKE